jgi:hypothetical protein
MSEIFHGTWAPDMHARIVARRALHYADGADRKLDRPEHVRAASGIARYGGRLAIIQDDANFVALLDPKSKVVRDIPLPAGEGGRRLFDKGRDNKKHKLDLEACFAVESGASATLVALGSGSREVREVIALVEPGTDGVPRSRLVRLPRLYEALRAHDAFTSSELNIEGAVWLGSHVRLFQRSNGKPHERVEALCATCDLSWPALQLLLHDPEHAPVPALENVRRYDLGNIEGVRLTFTDASRMANDKILFVASAEASPDAFDDGEVRGSALGLIDVQGRVRMCTISDAAGQLARCKMEGVTLADEPGKAYAVCDADDYDTPADILTLELAGKW